MYLKRLTALIICFGMLSSPLPATAYVQAVVALAIDESESMTYGKSPTHAQIQTSAIIEFLEHYNPSCTDVQVVLIPWGDKPEGIISGTIKTKFDAEALAEKIRNAPYKNYQTTRHDEGFNAGLDQLKGSAEIKILLFTTDLAADPRYTPARNMYLLVPYDVTVFAIGLGDTAVENYISTQVVRDKDKRWQVSTNDEFRESLKTVFSQIEDALCRY